MKNYKKELDDMIRKPISEFNIKEMILDTAPPFEWSEIKEHPIHQIGYYYFGVGDGFAFDEDKVKNCNEFLLWQLYGIIESYWHKFSSEINWRNRNMISSMRNRITIEDCDVGKNMLEVYERYYRWEM